MVVRLVTAALVIAVLTPEPAQASKYTGPTRVVATAKVLRVVDARQLRAQPRTTWRFPVDHAGPVAELLLQTIVSADRERWPQFAVTQFVPYVIYGPAKKGLKKGDIVGVTIHLGPRYAKDRPTIIGYVLSATIGSAQGKVAPSVPADVQSAMATLASALRKRDRTKLQSVATKAMIREGLYGSKRRWARALKQGASRRYFWQDKEGNLYVRNPLVDVNGIDWGQTFVLRRQEDGRLMIEGVSDDMEDLRRFKALRE